MTRPVDYYSLLGIERSASIDDIKRVIREKLKELHPDRTHTLSPELREYAQKRFNMLMEARKILLDPISKRRYDASLDTSFRIHVCDNCGETNYLPRQLRPGSIVCRSCGSELFTMREIPVDHAQVGNILFATLLTIRNMGLQNMAHLSVELARGPLSITIRSSGSRDYLSVIPAMKDLVDPEMRVLGIKKGRDRHAAMRMVQRLSVDNGPWLIRMTPLTNRWARWAATFVVSSLFSLTPGDARRILEEHSWNLVELARLHSMRPDYVERLKSNWKAMIEPAIPTRY